MNRIIAFIVASILGWILVQAMTFGAYVRAARKTGCRPTLHGAGAWVWSLPPAVCAMAVAGQVFIMAIAGWSAYVSASPPWSLGSWIRAMERTWMGSLALAVFFGAIAFSVSAARARWLAFHATDLDPGPVEDLPS